MGNSITILKNLASGQVDSAGGCVPCLTTYYKPGNPGTFDDIHKKYEALRPNNFDGARIIAKKILSRNFNATHTISMSSKNKEVGYIFGASYTGIKKVGPKERYPVLSGTIKPNGNLSANFIHTLGCRTRIKLCANIEENRYKSLRSTIEYRTDDCTVSAILIDPIVLKQEGVLILQYLQAISSRITLGAEIACSNYSKLGKQTNFAIGFRYSTGLCTLSLTGGLTALRICYHQKQSHNLQMGVEFQTNLMTNQSSAKILYQVDAPAADMVFKGFVDTCWKVGAVFEKQLYPIPEASLVLSTIFDHVNNDVSVGIGLNIGQ